MWRLTRFTPSTITRSVSARTLRTLAAGALVVAGDDDDFVVLLDPLRHHTTSGASEMIFMKLLPRSSRATGPKMRVPIGSF